MPLRLLGTGRPAGTHRQFWLVLNSLALRGHSPYNETHQYRKADKEPVRYVMVKDRAAVEKEKITWVKQPSG